jgi:hypothetical protein
MIGLEGYGQIEKEVRSAVINEIQLGSFPV